MFDRPRNQTRAFYRRANLCDSRAFPASEKFRNQVDAYSKASYVVLVLATEGRLDAFYVLLHILTHEPLVDILTGQVLVFPDKEIADTWKYEYDCTESYKAIALLPISPSVVRKLRKKIQLQKGENNG